MWPCVKKQTVGAFKPFIVLHLDVKSSCQSYKWQHHHDTHLPRILLTQQASYMCLRSKMRCTVWSCFSPRSNTPRILCSKYIRPQAVSIRKPLSSPNWKHLMIGDEPFFNWQLLDVVWSNVSKPNPNLISVHRKKLPSERQANDLQMIWVWTLFLRIIMLIVIHCFLGKRFVYCWE